MDDTYEMKSDRESRIKQTLDQVIHSFEASFPGRIRGYYLHGSLADDTAVATSDIDVTILFKGRFHSDTEKATANALIVHLAGDSAVELDAELNDEDTLFASADPAFKLGSRLLYGDDVRERMSLMPIADWTRDRMHSSYWRIVKLFNRPSSVTYPLDYPQPDDIFRGYCIRLMKLDDGTQVPCTRDFIRLTSWMGTAILAYKAEQYVVRKSDCHPAYQTFIGDDWGLFLESVYHNCKTRWSYGIPDQQSDRHLLQMLCEQCLDFENYFLQLYKEFLLTELGNADAKAITQAVWIQGEIPYHDVDIQRKLKEVQLE
jgi:hypothetical protein